MATGPTNQQGAVPQPGSSTPVGQPIGPLPAEVATGLVAQVIPVWANFHFLLDAINKIIITPATGITRIDTEFPILGGPITTTGVLSHATSGVAPGTYGDSTHTAQFKVNDRGHVEFADNVLIEGGGGGPVSITAVSPIVVTPSPITGAGVVSHGASGVTPGPYGDAAHYIIGTVDVDGHLTAISALPVNPGTAKFDWGKYIAGRGGFPIG